MKCEDVEKYGYIGEMVPFSAGEVRKIWDTKKVTVYELHPDNTETVVKNRTDIKSKHIYGINRDEYIREFSLKYPYVTGMDLLLEMDRPILPDHYICPGGYELQSQNGDIVAFDFTSYTGTVDEKRGDRIYCEMEDIDLDAFPDALTILSKRFLNNLEAIVECFIYTGEDCDEEINAKRILSWTLHFSDGTSFKIPDRFYKPFPLEL